MISLENVTKSYHTRSGGRRTIISGVNLTLPDSNIAVLGHNGAGKSTLLRMIAGIESPDAGQIHRHCSVSWPIGFRGSFHRELSGLENVRFVARVFGQNTEYIIDSVRDFAEIGAPFYAPVKTYSSGMTARLAFGLSMAISFDLYLVDELMAVGDARFQKKCREVFRDKMSQSKVVVVSHALKTLRDFCESGIVMHNGQITYFDNLEASIHAYNQLSAG